MINAIIFTLGQAVSFNIVLPIFAIIVKILEVFK